ncbi:MAG: ABC transporter permease, partial [Candidatus Aenigmarchaeota archaeon]|nr:ABC transporter permease [Candidatus Aenigmarchaeota archaeon]
MKTKKSLKLALNILRHSRLRSWLTIVGIVIGVAAVVAIISIGEGMQQSVEERLGALGSDIITVSPGFSRASGIFMRFGEGGVGVSQGSENTQEEGLTDRDIMVIRSVDNVAYVSGSISGRGDISYLAEEASVSIQGIDPVAWSQITTSELEMGRFLGPSDYNSVVVGSRVANGMFKQPLALNRILAIEGKSFKIVGILKESGGGFGGSGGDSGVVMTLNSARDIFQEQDEDFNRNEYNSITVKVTNDELIDETMDAIDGKLMLFRHVTDRTKDYTLSSSKSMQETVAGTTETITLFLAAIAAVSLLVGAVGIANTMFTTVLEKTKE